MNVFRPQPSAGCKHTQRPLSQTSARSRTRLLAPAQRFIVAAAASLCLVGCTAKRYLKSANKETYRAIEQKAAKVPNMDRHFTIEQTNLPFASTSVVTSTNGFEFLGADAGREAGAQVTTLEEALKTAVLNNRAYQARKEQLYLTALGLTLARHRFTPLFSGGGSAEAGGAIVVQERVDTVISPITGTPQQILRDEFVEDRYVSAGGDINVSWLIRDLGRVSASFSTDFLRFITGDPRSVTSSRAAATLVRPLLRNAGYKDELERLTQAERNLLYELRAFTQYRKTFSVQVASAYYAVLGNRDAVRNAYLNYRSSDKNAERTRALASEGRVTQSDLGRLEQQVLSSESSWNNALRAYQQALDDFKLDQLGVPVETRLVLDDGELGALSIQHPNINPEEAIKLGLTMRLDFMNTQDRHEDSIRQVALAKDFLKPDVDLVADVAIAGPRRSHGFSVPDAGQYSWSAGLDVDLPLDRKAERNSYRASMIDERQAARAVEQQADEIRLDLRESWRNLDRAKRNYEISALGVTLSEKRVEEQELLGELGRAKAQDFVDAQNDLISARNQRTQALVAHTIARLQFWVRMGILYIRDDGQWRELKDTDVPQTL